MNPELKIGDRVRCLLMKDDELSVPPGTIGIVERISNFGTAKHYYVKWENGSTLALLSDADLWDKGQPKKNKESNNLLEINMKIISQNEKVWKYFNMKLINNFLELVRRSGIINMFEASHLLFLGKDRIQRKFEDENGGDSEDFEKVLEMANEVQADLIHGVIEILNEEGKEESLENINLYLKKYSDKLLQTFIGIKS
jgi:oligoribonuclease NrnB/cAMP/cGMP phosphodiesterase (DHH superfamily)